MKTNHKIFIVLLIAMMSILVIKSARDQKQNKEIFATVVFEESRALGKAVLAFRTTFQDTLYALHQQNKTTPDSRAFPPYEAVHSVTELFNNTGSKNREVVSYFQRSGSQNNTPQGDKALEYFHANPKAKHFFEIKDQGAYHYAVPIVATDACATCHQAINHDLQYKTGDIAGVVSIHGTHSALYEQLSDQSFESMLFYAVTGSLAFLLIAFFVQKNYSKDERYKNTLEKEVKEHLEMLYEKNEEMRYQFFHDVMTSLPNRNQLIKDLAISSEHRALLLINLDDFKEVNDFYGQEIGDEMLVSVGNLLHLFAKEHDLHAYKLHADEYALLMHKASRTSLDSIITHLLAEIRDFVLITDEDHDIDITATVGGAVGEGSLLSHADMALKRAKKERISSLVYDTSMEIKEEYEKNIEWTRKIKRAIKDDRIVPYYQAIIQVAHPEIKRYEVLMRMISEDGSEIGPNHFLFIAKKSKLYHQLTRIMLAKSFEAMRDSDAHFSVNLSIIDILNPRTIAFIMEHIQAFPEPQRITFEILESEGIENYKEVLEFVKKVKAMGCSIAIDDFGSGYSSFEHILKLHVDVLKIDASLIKTIDTDKNARITVETILSFAKALGIKTCAEFVHSKAVYDVLETMGVDYVQGFYFAKPLPLDLVE